MGMAGTGDRRLDWRRDELIWRVAAAGSVEDAFAEASLRLRELVPFDAAVWRMTDPATGLPVFPRLVEGIEISAESSAEHWRREFVVEDFNLFRDLARAPVPAASLAETMGDPTASPRFRSFVRPMGFGDELRAVLRAGGCPRGVVILWRNADRPAFSGRDVQLVAGLCDPLGEAIRSQARNRHPNDGTPPADRPGFLLFNVAGELASIDEQGRAWLAELPDDQTVSTDLGVALPVWIAVTATQAAAARRTGGQETVRSRARSRRGDWLACHASSQRGGRGGVGPTLVVIEPARPAELAEIVADAHDLTDRERQVAALVARGAGTREIAQQLYVSPHTVRDHLKAIFAKLSVSSRGELVATLYAA